MGKTRGVHETTPEIRNRMVGMYEAGLGLRDIAVAVNCSQRTVKRWLNRFNKEGTVETRERCGRKRATTTEQDDAIIRLATQTPITAAKAVLPALGLTCSVDTIRERLHKAGIHNWSPSRKHMQRITIGDSATIQKAVWRPTGTQLGKKKLATKDSNSKSKRATTTGAKKKTRPLKIRARDVYVRDGTTGENQKEPSDQESGNFVYEQPSVAQQETHFTQENDDMNVKNESLSNYQAGFSNTLGLVQTTQPQVYQHHHGLNIVQSWPLDLVQAGNHNFSQGGTHPMDHQQHQSQHLQELHTQREREQHIQQPHENLEHHTHCMDNQVHQMISQENISTASVCQEERMHLNDCSNSSTSNDQSSDNDEYSKNDSKSSETETNSSENRKKKGGKAKGTLETSVELRNRMIGMSEAGLSTLSIALAINRSERTVKRWLERWNKEGNVQTKERKGRRRITTKEQDDAIVAMATQNPLTAAKHVAPALGLNCSVDTIRERLHKAGIHSWKLGKKEGKGNSVHTVHLWQPSGNRPNKTKLLSDKKKASSEKKRAPSSVETKRTQRKKKSVEENESPEDKTIPPPPTMIPPPPTMQFHENVPMTSYVPGPEMMHPVHNLAAPSLVSSVNGPQIGSSVPVSMQVMGPVMQQRSDCRMANPVIPPEPPNPSVAYPSCMISASNTHPTHMDQQDPLNYEPYIWSF